MTLITSLLFLQYPCQIRLRLNVLLSRSCSSVWRTTCVLSVFVLFWRRPKPFFCVNTGVIIVHIYSSFRVHNKQNSREFPLRQRLQRDDGLSTSCEWAVRRLSMGYTRTVRRLSVGCPRSVRGLPRSCLRAVQELCCLRTVRDLSLACPQAVHGPPGDYAWVLRRLFGGCP